MPLKIAVCDDEKIIREQLLELIGEAGDFSVDLFSSGDALLNAGTGYDIYFLDIQMPGTNGIKAAEQIRRDDSDSIIIFITALKEYMQNAFDVQAFHYLVKPIAAEKFKEVFAKAAGRLRKDKNGGGHLLIKTGNSYNKIPLKDIFYAESQGKKVILRTKTGAYDYYGTMREIENTAGDAFFRCHRCFIVNMDHIIRYNSDTVWLKNGERILLAQKKYPQFTKTFMAFIRNGGYDA